jgi:hypothetical protein
MGGYSISLSKQKRICTHVLFRTVSEIETFCCTVPKLLIRKRDCVLLLTQIFIDQVTKLVQFTQYNWFSKIPPSVSMQFLIHVRTKHVARLCSVVYSETALSRKPFGIWHMYIYIFLLRMTILWPPTIWTSPFWDILCSPYTESVLK